MKRKIALTGAFILSLLPMLINQYGGMKGVQEISGLINLLNPIGIVSVILFFTGVWLIRSPQIIGKLLGAIGVIGIVLSELNNFLFWYVETITGQFSLQYSIRFAFPEFYFGLLVSILMIVVYFLIDIIVKGQKN